jgi:hypothetical protein
MQPCNRSRRGLHGCIGARPEKNPLPPADPAGQVHHEHLPETTGGISVATEHAEAISGLRGLKRPREGKEEATEVIAVRLTTARV